MASRFPSFCVVGNTVGLRNLELVRIPTVSVYTEPSTQQSEFEVWQLIVRRASAHQYHFQTAYDSNDSTNAQGVFPPPPSLNFSRSAKGGRPSLAL